MCQWFPWTSYKLNIWKEQSAPSGYFLHQPAVFWNGFEVSVILKKWFREFYRQRLTSWTNGDIFYLDDLGSCNTNRLYVDVLQRVELQLKISRGTHWWLNSHSITVFPSSFFTWGKQLEYTLVRRREDIFPKYKLIPSTSKFMDRNRVILIF